MDTAVAAISTATAGVSENPGRCAASRPATAPTNKAGNVGPPRKLPSEMLQASALEQEQQRQGGQGQGGALCDQAAEGVLAGEQDDIRWLVGDLGKRDRQASDGQAGRR